MSVNTHDNGYCTVEIGGRRNLPIDSLRATRKLNAHNSDKSLNSSDGYISRIKSVIVLVIFLTSTGLIVYLFVRTSRIQEQNVILEQRLEQLQSDQVKMAVANKLCIPCSELSQGPFPEDNLGVNDLIQDTEDGAIVCCAKTSVQILLFLNLVTTKFSYSAIKRYWLIQNETTTCISGSIYKESITELNSCICSSTYRKKLL